MAPKLFKIMFSFYSSGFPLLLSKVALSSYNADFLSFKAKPRNLSVMHVQPTLLEVSTIFSTQINPIALQYSNMYSKGRTLITNRKTVFMKTIFQEL
jgi:hypothetical protein